MSFYGFIDGGYIFEHSRNEETREVTTGFVETVVSVKTLEYGNIAHSYVVYEASILGSDRPPQRGLDSWHLMKKEHGANRPSKIIVTNRSQPRLDEIREFHRALDSGVPTEYVLAPTPDVNDAACARLKPGSLVVNATGLGKDAPGSPLTGAAVFPLDGFAWEFNYRGELVFLDQARAQAKTRRLTVEDGWIYFIHGWTRVIAEVFHVNIPTAGPEFDRLSQIAGATRK